MPGVSLKCIFNEKNKATQNYRNELFLDASNSILHNNYYKEEILLNEHPYCIVCTKYPGYPLTILDNGVFWICIEGKIYNKNPSTLQNEIYDLTKHIFNFQVEYDGYRRVIADWLTDADGDFILYGFNRNTKDLFVLNDLLGRLPFYYTENGGEIIASREIQLMSYILDNTDKKNKFDMMGIAQFLLFSHTVGKRTLLSNISRLEPATLLILRKNTSEIEAKNIHNFNFENKNYADVSTEKNVQQLIALFDEGCKNRVDSKAKNLVSLSGGFDSRVVAACLHKNKVNFSAVTSPEPNWKPVVGDSKETDVAKKLADTWNIECETYNIMIPNAASMVSLLKYKNGLTYLAHSFLLRFLEEIRRNHETPVTFFTGHGGDVSFANLSFDIPDLDTCVRGIYRVKGRLPFDIVMAVTGIQASQITEEIRNTLTSYPEENPSAKLEHFLFFENNAKFSFEIEDLNRLYFWTVAPFYSIPFFKYIFNCSDESKEKLALYKEFLTAMSPVSASITNSNWGCSIMSTKFKILQHILHTSFKYPRLRRIIKRFYDKRSYSYKDGDKIIRCIREQIQDCTDISKFLSVNVTEKLLDKCIQYSHEGIDNLLTVTSLLEQSLCDKNAIEKYY